MSNNCRFALDEKRNIIDTVNVANSGKVYFHQRDLEGDRHLRERILQWHLHKLTNKLIINLRPIRRDAAGHEFEPDNEESFAIYWAMFDAIRASHLNTFDPALSVQHKFDGKLRRQKEHTQDFTSLALFRDDVERLLRDLYGDVESEAMDSIVEALFDIVRQFTRCVRPDLCNEHWNAMVLDAFFGIGVDEEFFIGGWKDAMEAEYELIGRVREVNAKPAAFSEYTIEFANFFAQRCDCSKDPFEEVPS
jgi:hypothetical protein